MTSIAETEPAEIVPANDTSHMVASFILLHFGFANGTEPDSAVLVDPAFKFLFHVFFARLASVPLISALEANLSSTVWACDFLGVQRLAKHRPLTTGLGAPAHQWVTFLGLLFDKGLEFGNQLRMSFFKQRV